MSCHSVMPSPWLRATEHVAGIVVLRGKEKSGISLFKQRALLQQRGKECWKEEFLSLSLPLFLFLDAVSARCHIRVVTHKESAFARFNSVGVTSVQPKNKIINACVFSATQTYPSCLKLLVQSAPFGVACF